MKLRALAVAVFGLVLAAASWLPAGRAQAAGSCTFIPPSRIVVSSGSQLVRYRYGPDCTQAGTQEADWTGMVGNEQADYWGYPYASETYYDWAHLGVWTWRPDGASDRNFDDEAQNAPQMTVRLGSKAYLRVAHVGNRVMLWTRDSRYFNVSPGGWHFYAGWHGQLQWRYVGYQTWHPLKDTHQDSSGVFTYTYRQRAERDYRVVFPDNSVVWGSTSPVVRG